MLQRLRTLASHWFSQQRVTRVGLAYVATVVAMATTALLSANNLLFLMLAALLGTLLLSGFMSRLSLAGLELDFRMPEQISARRKAAVRIVLRNLKRWLPSFSIHLTGTPPSVLTSVVYFPVIPSGSRLQETVEVVFGRRGLHRENGFRLTSRFPFGFTERVAQVALRREVLVYPCLDPQPGFEDLLTSITGDMAARQRGRGHEFYRIRPYTPLESSRHVDWKATAHTGELQVREFVREQDPLIEIFLDLESPEEDPAWFERAVDCCAFLVWRVSLRDARIRFRSQDYDCSVPAEGDVHAILKYLALVAPKTGRSLIEPAEEHGCRVVFSSRQRSVAERGWADALVIGPGGFPLDDTDGARAGADDH